MMTAGVSPTSWSASAFRNAPALDIAPEGVAPDALERVLDCLRAGGFDFADYQRPSLERRVAARLRRVGVTDVGAYTEFLRHCPAEGAALCETLWINVTGFFRDRSVWEVLRTQVLPHLLARKGPGGPIRVWSAGCATGEEAYSLAVLLAEALGPEGLDGRVEIVATDVDPEALACGERGVYSDRAMDAVPLPLWERYFVPINGGWQVQGELRRAVRFRRQNLLRDQPPGKFDLIVCRNTLMYFRPEAQAQVLARLRRSLQGDGCLLLGRGECPIFHNASRPFGERFTPVDLKTHLYETRRS